MNKISAAQLAEMTKVAAESLRALSEENQTLREKVAHYEKRSRVEKIASIMQQKGLESELTYEQKIAGLLQRDDLQVVEEAVGMSAPQMKLASVQDRDNFVSDGGADVDSNQAASQFAAALASD